MITYGNLLDSTFAFCLSKAGCPVIISEPQLRCAKETEASLREKAKLVGLSIQLTPAGWKVGKEMA